MKQDYHHIYETCKQHMHAYVLVEMTDGSKIDGIVTGLDGEYVYLAVPVEVHDQGKQSFMHNQRYPHGYGPGFGYTPGGGFPSGYGYSGGTPPRRFNRLVLPLIGLTALSLLPWY